jgi:hypothetical protein
MKERLITSDRLGNEPVPLGEQAGMLDLYDGLATPFSASAVELTPAHVDEIEAYVRQAAAHFGPRDGAPEQTFAQHERNVPALVVRVDCTIIDGKVVAYEMEDSPSGQGITDTIHRAVGAPGIKALLHSHYDEQIGQLPHVVVSGERSHGTDDALIVGADRYTFDQDRSLVLPDGQLVIVKAIPGNEASVKGYEHFQPRALAPLLTEGDKTYLERIGDLRNITHADQLLHDDNGELTSQVLKARLGSMALGVSIYLNPQDRQTFGRKKTVTASRLATDLAGYRDTRGGALVQEFAPPIRITNDEERSNAILRVFVLLQNNGNEIQADAIGGCYVARPELVVHGASNAVAGAVLLPERQLA